MQKYTAMYKYELAAAAGVSLRTLSTWCHSMSDELASCGVSRKTKLLPPKAVQLLSEKYGINV